MAAKNQTQTTSYGASGKTSSSTGSSTSNKTSTTQSSTQGGSTTVKGAAGVVSDKTQAGFNQATQDYVQSDRVNQAYQQLNGLQKPLDYQSTYEGQLGNLYDKIMQRDPFSFNMNSDKLYQEYRDLYQKQGQQAMKDTIGATQALSGGYGNSYAATAGQQAYQNYLEEIDRMLPEFEQMAYKTYQAEGENLMNKYNVTNDRDKSDYAKYRDQVRDYQSDRAFYSNAYRDERNFDYGQYVDNRNFWQDEFWKERNAAQVTDSSYWQNSTKTMQSTEETTSSSSSSWTEAPTSHTTETTVYPTVAASTKTATPTTKTATGAKTGNDPGVRDYSADAQYKLGIKPNTIEPERPTFRDYSATPQDQAKRAAAEKAAQVREQETQNRMHSAIEALEKSNDPERTLVDLVNKGRLNGQQAGSLLNYWRR